MSTSIAGKTQEATLAQAKAGTKTGSSADLVMTPDVVAQVIQEGDWIYSVSSDITDTYTANLTPALIAYTIGMKVRIKFTTANTGACSLNLNSLGAKNIKTRAGNDPADGDIAAGGIIELTYDGTNFILPANKATTSEQGIVEMATDSEVATGTDQERYINPKQAKDNYGTSIIASDSVVANVTSALAHSNTTYTKVHEMVINKS